MEQEEVIKNIANTRERLAELLEQAKTCLLYTSDAADEAYDV